MGKKPIDEEKTIQAILAKHSPPFVIVNEKRLREEVKKNQKFIFAAAKAVGVEVIFE